MGYRVGYGIGWDTGWGTEWDVGWDEMGYRVGCRMRGFLAIASPRYEQLGWSRTLGGWHLALNPRVKFRGLVCVCVGGAVGGIWGLGSAGGW